jgi:hypothetical protein
VRWREPCAPTRGPNGGVADSLNEAKAAFQAAWERARVMLSCAVDTERELKRFVRQLSLYRAIHK